MANSTLDVYNYSSFTNNGAGVDWIPFDMAGTDYHRIVTMIDPTTGLPRLIFGNDQGIWSVLDDNGTFETQIGASDALPAQQPQRQSPDHSVLLRGGAAQQRGRPDRRLVVLRQCPGQRRAQLDAGDIIDSGNIVWNGPGGDAAGVATDQQGTGTLYQYFWPCCGGGRHQTSSRSTASAETYGLLQASDGDPTPDPQWPFKGGANFAVNPVNGQDIVISSSTGNIFSTTNEGVTWFDIGEPAVFGSPGSFSVALAYGAPDPTAPEGVGNLGNFIYVGTATGQVYVTQDGGGSGGSNNWINISTGLDGSAVSRSSPTRPAAATTPMPSPVTASTTSPTRSPRPAIRPRPGSTSLAISRLWPTPSSARAMTPRPTPTPSPMTWRSPCPRSPPTGAIASPTTRPTRRPAITRCCTSVPIRACFNQSTAVRPGPSSRIRATAR